MKALEWVEKIKTTHGIESDYAVAKMLGVSRFTVSGYRNRPGATFDEEIAFKVAEALGIDPVGIIIDQVAERSKSPAVASALHDAARRICILCKVPDAMGLLAIIARPLSAIVV
jgi:transcriptional regulator with XRE-family HTH domain